MQKSELDSTLLKGDGKSLICLNEFWRRPGQTLIKQASCSRPSGRTRMPFFFFFPPNRTYTELLFLQQKFDQFFTQPFYFIPASSRFCVWLRVYMSQDCQFRFPDKEQFQRLGINTQFFLLFLLSKNVRSDQFHTSASSATSLTHLSHTAEATYHVA